MQNIDEILPVILHSSILKRPSFFCFFEIKPYLLACNPIFGSSRGVQKELGKNLFFPRNPPRGISCIRGRVE